MKLPQLTLRDLFWLILVAACLCGWWTARSSAERERSKLLRAIQEAGFRVATDGSYRLEPSWPAPNDHNWYSGQVTVSVPP